MSADLAGAQRLADAVKARRDERGWTQQDVVQQGRLSLNRIQAIEAGRTARYRRTTLEDLDRGLKWAQGSAAKVLYGDSEPRRRKTTHSYGVSDVHSRFVERMRQVRKHRHLTDDELADRVWNTSGIDWDPSTLSKIQHELRGLSLTEAWLIAEALQVPFADMCNPEPLVIETRIEVP